MKIKQFSFGKTYNTGNYTSQRLDITVEVDENESLDSVKIACEMQLDRVAAVNSKEYKGAFKVLNDIDNYTGAQVKKAKEIILAVDGRLPEGIE